MVHDKERQLEFNDGTAKSCLESAKSAITGTTYHNLSRLFGCSEVPIGPGVYGYPEARQI